MVDRSYLLDKPPAPGRVKAAFDQRAIPLLIDAAGTVEAGLERVAATVRRSPGSGVLIAAGAGFLLAQAARLRRR